MSVTNKPTRDEECSSELHSSSPVRLPTPKKMKELAQRIGIDLSDEEVMEYREMMRGMITCFGAIDKIPEPTLTVKYPRLPGYRPSAKENPLNAWYWKTNIIGSSSGILKGKRIALKDTIAVSGVPMMGGSWIMENYVPEFDATVTTRILDAGGVIAGKSLCEDFCLSAKSFLSAKGPVLNPHNAAYNAGGSSSGSAVLVSTGEVDMAIGGDQGGSVRLPASSCGIVGLKPTYGLVPYTGAQSIDATVDHLGPMAKTVYDCALLLEAIAGYDNGLDPRQQVNLSPDKYTKALESTNLEGIKIGLLKEGFEQKDSDARVNDLIRQGVAKLAVDSIKDVSVPIHNDAGNIWLSFGYQGIADTMLRGGSTGSGFKGFYPTSMMDAVGRGLSSQADDLSPSVKSCWLLGEYMKREYRGKYYGKAQNIRRLVTAEFNKAFEEVDIIAMPTIPFPPGKIPPQGTSITGLVADALSGVGNTITFNVTGHPALSINAGFIDGLPIGLMLVGRMFDEKTLLKVAHAFEQVR